MTTVQKGMRGSNKSISYSDAEAKLWGVYLSNSSKKLDELQKMVVFGTTYPEAINFPKSTYKYTGPLKHNLVYLAVVHALNYQYQNN